MQSGSELCALCVWLAVYADWSPWSACSASCGQGRQSRSLSCTESVFHSPKDATDESHDRRHGNCVPNDTPRVQVRTCWVQACAGAGSRDVPFAFPSLWLDCVTVMASLPAWLSGFLCVCALALQARNSWFAACVPAFLSLGVWLPARF